MRRTVDPKARPPRLSGPVVVPGLSSVACVRVPGRPVLVVRPRVERADERVLRVEEEQAEDDREAEQAAVEADLLQLRVAAHAERDEERREDGGDDRGGEDALRLAPEGDAAVPADDCRERLEELLHEDVRVDGDPVPVDEPPAADGEHEADPAADHAADPDVVAARPRHDRDQRRVDDRLEEEVGAREEHRREQETRLRDERPEGEDVEAERDQVDREGRVDERVLDRPAAHEAGGLPYEERPLLVRHVTRVVVAMQFSSYPLVSRKRLTFFLPSRSTTAPSRSPCS